MTTRKTIFLGSFIGAMLVSLISSTYFYVVFRSLVKKLKSGFEKWDDLKNF